MTDDRDFTVYAIKLQPNGQTGFFDACREEEVIGTGWDPKQPCENIEELEKAHKRVHKDVDHKRIIDSGKLRHELRYIVKGINGGSDGGQPDYVWVNEGGEYAICKVTSECTTSHDVSGSLRERLTNEKGSQIHNIRHVEWRDVPVEFVPGYVKRKFTGQFGTLRKMDKGVDDHAKGVIQKIHAVDDFDAERTLDIAELEAKLKQTKTSKLFNTLDADDTEELVLDYLQSQGWRITKYTTGDSQAKYECELRRVSDEGREAGFVQVKSGDASLSPEEYEELADQGQVFLFQGPDGNGQQRLCAEQDGITAVEPRDLVDHLRENTRWLPTPTLLRLSISL